MSDKILLRVISGKAFALPYMYHSLTITKFELMKLLKGLSGIEQVMFHFNL